MIFFIKTNFIVDDCISLILSKKLVFYLKTLIFLKVMFFEISIQDLKTRFFDTIVGAYTLKALFYLIYLYFHFRLIIKRNFVEYP